MLENIISGKTPIESLTLTMTLDYVSGWGDWEVFREIVQNHLDEKSNEDDAGVKIYQEDKYAVFENKGKLQYRHLLLGGGDKRGNSEKRGEFGEGMKLAFGVAVRSGKELWIHNHDEVWIPCKKELYGEVVLGVEIFKAVEDSGCVMVYYELDEDRHEKMSSRIMDLRSETNKYEVGGNKILLDKDLQCSLFVKGIFIQEMEKGWKYGYDFGNVKTDRDRNVLGLNIVESKTRSMLESYMWIYEPYKGYDFLVGLSDYREASIIGESKNSYFGSWLKEQFIERYGEKAVPVRTPDDREVAKHYGFKPIVVEEYMFKLMNTNKMTLEWRKKELSRKWTKEYELSELSEVQRKNWVEIVEMINEYSETWRSCIERLKIVDFEESDTLGMYTSVAGKEPSYCISINCLNDRSKLLHVIFHEFTHSVGNEGSPEHEEAIVEAIVEVLFNLNDDRLLGLR